MSFCIQVKCSGEEHPVVVDLTQRSVLAPAHSAELIQRYKALYELGGEPLPCCLLAIWWSENIYPGYLRLESMDGEPEVSALLRSEIHLKIYRLTGYYEPPMIIMPGDKAPSVVGHDGYHTGGKGQIIKNVPAYHQAGGVTVHHKPTRRILVGEDWMITNNIFTRPNGELLT